MTTLAPIADEYVLSAKWRWIRMAIRPATHHVNPRQPGSRAAKCIAIRSRSA